MNRPGRCHWVLSPISGGLLTLNYIISLSSTSAFIVALLYAGLLIAGSLVLLRLFHRRVAIQPLGIPAPPFIAAIATAWALSLGFVSADIWAINAKAENWASQERSAISQLAGTASPDALNWPVLLQAVEDYAAASTQYEWVARANSAPAPEVEAVLQRIRVEIVNGTLGNNPTALMNKLVKDFDQLQDARDMRLGIGARSINVYKWYLVFSLTVLTLITIAVTHADRPAAGRNAILIFTATATVSIWILVLHANPYHGVEGIKPAEVNVLFHPVADPTS